MVFPIAKLYGVTNALVLSDYLPQFSTTGARLPGTDIISNKIDIAGADFDEALTEGGYSADAIDETDTPTAFERARDIIATRAALLYAAVIGHNLGNVEFDEMFKGNNRQLDRLRQGKPFGDLTVSGGSRQAVFKTGDDSRSTINDRRCKLTDPL